MATTGQQNSPDIVGNEGEKNTKVFDGPREPKGGAGHLTKGPNEEARNPAAATTKESPVQMVLDQLAKAQTIAAASAQTKRGSPLPTSLETYVDGFGAAMDAVKWAQDVSKIFEITKAMTTFEKTNMQPGEVAPIHVALDANNQTVITKLPDINAPVFEPVDTKSFRTILISPCLPPIDLLLEKGAVVEKYVAACDAAYSAISKALQTSKPNSPPPTPSPKPHPHGGGGGKYHHDQH